MHDEGEFLFIVYYPVVVAMFVANFFADQEPRYRIDGAEKSSVSTQILCQSYIPLLSGFHRTLAQRKAHHFCH